MPTNFWNLPGVAVVGADVHVQRFIEHDTIAYYTALPYDALANVDRTKITDHVPAENEAAFLAALGSRPNLTLLKALGRLALQDQVLKLLRNSKVHRDADYIVHLSFAAAMSTPAVVKAIFAKADHNTLLMQDFETILAYIGVLDGAPGGSDALASWLAANLAPAIDSIIIDNNYNILTGGSGLISPLTPLYASPVAERDTRTFAERLRAYNNIRRSAEAVPQSAEKGHKKRKRRRDDKKEDKRDDETGHQASIAKSLFTYKSTDTGRATVVSIDLRLPRLASITNMIRNVRQRLS